MIVPMHRLDLLCPAEEREVALALLGRLGVVHLTPLGSENDVAVEELAAKLASVRAVLGRLPQAEAATLAGATDAPAAIAARAASLLEQRDALLERLQALQREMDAVAPLGRYNAAELAALRQAGVVLTLYRVPRGARLPEVAGAVWEQLHQDGGGTLQVLAGLEPPPALAFPPLPWPARTLGEVEAAVEDLSRQLSDLVLELTTLARHRPVLETHAHDLAEALRWAEARQGMAVRDAGTALAHLRGHVPEDAAAGLAATCAAQGWAALLEPVIAGETSGEEIGALEGEGVSPPILLRYPSWLDPVRTVFEAVGILPGYHEADVGAPVLVFLSLFFAMLVGDAGYGLLFLAAALLGRRLWPAVPRRAFVLLAVMSTATVVWGALTGVWFGAARLPGLLAGLRLDWLTGAAADRNLMALCFLLGAVHLSLAHVWNVLRLWPSLTALAQLGWTGVVWTMYFAARLMVLGEAFPVWMGWIAAASALLIVLFMTPRAQLKARWTDHVMLPLNFISNFVDVVSYVRLYAVGAASLAMAQAVNAMAVGEGVSGPVAGLLAAAVLFVGHAGNILLACMGVLVHGVRLNTLEFANHLGLSWAGTPYAPFQVSPTAVARALDRAGMDSATDSVTKVSADSVAATDPARERPAQVEGV